MSVSASGYQLKKPVNVDRPRPDHKLGRNHREKARIAAADGAISLDQAVAMANGTGGQVRVVS